MPPPPGAFSPIAAELAVSAEDYEIDDRIAGGSYGIVYRAVQRSTGRRVAIKFFDYFATAYNSDAAYVDIEIERQQETAHIESFAKLLGVFFDTPEGLLSTKGLVKRTTSVYYPYARITVARQKALVMELLEGGEVWDLVSDLNKAKKQLSERDCSVVLETCVHAFLQLHAMRRINPDFKMENCVFVHKFVAGMSDADRLMCKVIDQGMNQVLQPGSHSHYSPRQLGSPPFVAPESRAEGKYSALSDVFQLGCMLHLMLTALKPFDDQGRPYNHETDRAHLGEGAKALLKKMLAPEAERISMADILQETFIVQRNTLSDADLGPDYVKRVKDLLLSRRFRRLLQECADNGHRKMNAVLQAVPAISTINEVEKQFLLDGGTFHQLRQQFMTVACLRPGCQPRESQPGPCGCNGDVSRAISRESLKMLLSECGQGHLATDAVCSVLDDDRPLDGVDYTSFVTTLTAFRAPDAKRVDSQFFFEILDLNLDGKLSQDEVVSVLSLMLNAPLANGGSPRAYVAESEIIQMFQVLDFNNDGGVDAAEFRAFIDHNFSSIGSSSAGGIWTTAGGSAAGDGDGSGDLKVGV